MTVLSVAMLMAHCVEPVSAQSGPPSEVDFGGKSWTLYNGAVVRGHNNEYLYNVNRAQCVQYCIDNVFQVPADCWSVEFISGKAYDAA